MGIVYGMGRLRLKISDCGLKIEQRRFKFRFSGEHESFRRLCSSRKTACFSVAALLEMTIR